ncbi:ChbG/HpnK family deacetylase [Candidatus Poribacteria bacterium]|nr:ChbG/HpnK family deacetylase [Candidatus Poribacteria bacterium]
METYLIVNADEFGLTEGVNDAIIDCHRNGIVTSTTLMTNAWAFEDAVSHAQRNPSLGIGVHINLTFGSPVARTDSVSSLVGPDGKFLPRSLLLKQWLRGGLRVSHVETEIRAQLQKTLDAGIEPTHIDSHQNTMMIPTIFKVFLKVAEETRMPVRLPYEPPNFDGFSSILHGFVTWRHAKKRFTSALCRRGRPSLRIAGVRTINRVYSLPSCFMPPSLSVVGRYEALMRHVRPGICEMLTHPGSADDRLAGFLGGSIQRARQREEERAALVSERLKEVVHKQSIRLINYKGLEQWPKLAEN